MALSSTEVICVSGHLSAINNCQFDSSWDINYVFTHCLYSSSISSLLASQTFLHHGILLAFVEGLPGAMGHEVSQACLRRGGWVSCRWCFFTCKQPWKSRKDGSPKKFNRKSIFQTSIDWVVPYLKMPPLLVEASFFGVFIQSSGFDPLPMGDFDPRDDLGTNWPHRAQHAGPVSGWDIWEMMKHLEPGNIGVWKRTNRYKWP